MPPSDSGSSTDGEVCHKCGQPYPTVYCVPDRLWRQVTGRNDGGGLLCPRCFDAEARAQGAELYWQARKGEFPNPRILD